ncbi:MAG: peptidoglycan DD-metalloendopeptidase family protein [Acidimicrobiia bacterium]
MESRTTRLLLVTSVALASVLGSCVPPAEGRAGPTDPFAAAWARPVSGGVVRPFVAPRSRYGAGHRGVDLGATPGTPVVAVGSGTVTFAGSVAGSLHVGVDHGGGIRTSLSFLASVAVRRGQRVVRGQVLGVAGGAGPDHDPGVVHLGLRVAGSYVDPMRLFAPLDLVAAIHLAPVHDRPARTGLDSPMGEARSLADSLRLPQHIPGLEPPPDRAWWEVARDGLGSFLTGVMAVAEVQGRPLLVAWHWFLATPPGTALRDLGRIARRIADHLRSGDRCTAGASARVGPGSGHLLFAVGGINSETDRRTGRTFDLDTRALGYHRGEVGWFSYRPGGGAYGRPDTYRDLLAQGRQLRDQLRAFARRRPGREVDLIAHSQGGVVVDAFLAYAYDPADPTLPPLGNVVTLSSPHRGATIARVAAAIGSGPRGRLLLREATRAADGAVPPVDGPSTRQLDPDSQFMRRLRSAPLPGMLDLTSIGATDDVVVDELATERRGARSVLVNPAGAADHSLIVHDPQAMRAARLALELRPPECTGLLAGIRGAVEPVVIRRVELTLGEAAHRVLDGAP